MVAIISRRHLLTKPRLLTFLVMIQMLPQHPLAILGLPWAVPAVMLVPDPFNDQQHIYVFHPLPDSLGEGVFFEADMNSQPVISFAGVGKAFQHDLTRKKAVALHNLTFAVSAGEAFGIIGPNGAGKSTALKILMGFSRADRGVVTVGGQGPGHALGHQMIGYLPENPCLYENLTITDHLRFAARTTGFSGPVAPRIKELLALVGLSGEARLPIRRFSKGMTQRAALAYALFHDPDLLVLDEPMSGLDPLGRQMVVDIIRQCHARGKTILFCSHILTDVERICDRIAIMNRGELQSITTPKELNNYVIAPELPPGTTPLEACFLEIVRDGKPAHRPYPAGEAA